MSDEEIGTPVDVPQDVIVEDVTDPEPIEAEVVKGHDQSSHFMQICVGTKKNGEKCRSPVVHGTDFCGWHQPDGVVPRLKKELVTEPDALDEPVYGVLKPYPFHDGGVNENAAIRMISMVIPLCPMDSNPEILKKDGTSIPNPRYTGEPNCQQAFKKNEHGVWDVARCISLGHNPYYTVFRKPRTEEVLDAQGYVTESKVRVLKEERLNIIQVSDNPRHTNRTEVALALAKGCKFLEEFGIASPCEFRNCTQPQRIDTKYGKYCSERHARLIAADFKRVILPVGGDPYTQDQAMDERNSMLENLNIRKGG